MFRRSKLTRLMCGGHALARTMVLALLFIALIFMFYAVPPVLIGYSRHTPWQGSGLEDAAFFTRNFRFSWSKYNLAPAYFKLKDKLSQMEGCTAVSVDYAEAYLENDENVSTLCIYPTALAERIRLPLSEGELVEATNEDQMPVVLDRRLRRSYQIGDTFTVTCAWTSGGQYTSVERKAVVTGFLNADNDHISTLGGSNAKVLQYFASKALSGSAYVIITTESSFPDKPYTGDCTSTLLLAPEGESANDYIDAWREEIAEWNLGQIDSYADILNGDTWQITVLNNIDFYFLTGWMMVLMILGLIGFSLMQTETLQMRLSMFEMIGMTKSQLIRRVIAGCYVPFWIVNLVGIIIGSLIAYSNYKDYIAVLPEMTAIALALTMIPHLIALAVDCIRIYRSNALQQWTAGR